MADLVFAIEQVLDTLVDRGQKGAKVNAADVLRKDCRVRHQLLECEPAAQCCVEQRNRAIRCVHGAHDVQIRRHTEPPHTDQ